MNILLDALTKLGFDWSQALFGLFNFLIAFYILKKYVFNKLSKVLEERQQKIKKGLDNYEKAEANLRNSELETKKIISKAKQEAQSIIDQSTKDAEKRAVYIMEHTNDKAKEVLNKANEQIQKEKQKMIGEMKSEIAEIVSTSVEVILKKKIGENENKELIQNSIDQVYEAQKSDNN